MKIFKHTVARIRNSKGEFEGIPALTGENIYEMAVRNGYLGSEEEYLAEIISDGWVTGIAKLQTEVDAVETDVSTLETKVTTLETDKITATTYTGTLLASGWTASSSTTTASQSITINGLLTTDIIIVDINMPSSGVVSTMRSYVDDWSRLLRVKCTEANTLSFLIDGDAPTVDIPIKVLVVK